MLPDEDADNWRNEGFGSFGPTLALWARLKLGCRCAAPGVSLRVSAPDSSVRARPVLSQLGMLLLFGLASTCAQAVENVVHDPQFHIREVGAHAVQLSQRNERLQDRCGILSGHAHRREAQS